MSASSIEGGHARRLFVVANGSHGKAWMKRLGETGCAIVVPKPDRTLTMDEMSRYFADKGVARFKIPERLLLVDALPKTPSGKVQKFILRQSLKATGTGTVA